MKNKIVEVNDIDAKRRNLAELINSVPKESSFREDLIFSLKKHVIVSFALTYNFKKVLLGTTSHKVACHLFSQLCKGRGASVAHDVSFVDDRLFGGRVSLMNPLRDFLKKEIGIYNHNRSVPII